MGVKLTIEVEGPLSPDDRKMMTGVGMTIIAVAAGDEEGGEEEESGQDPAEVEEEPLPEMQQVAHQMYAAGQLHETPDPCGKPDPLDSGKVCAGDVGHRGRHLYRLMPMRYD